MPYKLIEAAAAGDVELVTSPALLNELRDVLGREHLASRLAAQRSTVEQAIALYAELAISVSPVSTPRVVPGDVDDDHIIAAAVAAGAQFVVSGDRHLLSMGNHQGIDISNAAEAVRRLATARRETQALTARPELNHMRSRAPSLSAAASGSVTDCGAAPATQTAIRTASL